MPNTPVRSVQTTLRLIDGLRELGGAGVTELADHLGLSKSTAYNHLATLEQNEYIVKEGDTYYIGCRFLELGAQARDRHRVYTRAQPEVKKLAQQTGELSGLIIEEHGRGVFLYRAKGEEAVHVDTYTGKRIYLHTAALGKAILAHVPRGRVEDIIEQHGLPRMTDFTITDPETLFEELAEIRENRIAFDDEERLRGLRSVAAPVLTDDGEVLGAISVAGPTSRMRGERFEVEVPELVTSAANVIELNVSHA